MLEVLKVVILGIVEGITEWLPISSTGHLILVEEFVKLKMSDSFMSMFNVVIQLGAILAVVVIYFHKLNPFSATKTNKQKMLTLQLWVKVIVASVPAAIIGLLFDDYIDAHLMNYVVVAIMLIFYGILFIIVEKQNEQSKPTVRRLSDLTIPMALIIGGFQVLALIPGTSRSGATIIGGLLLGAARGVAAEFTFFLAIPVMFGASFLKIIKFGLNFTGMEFFLLLLGCVVSFGVSIFAIKFLMKYIKNHDFKVFGYYRIVLGAIVLLYFGMSALFA
jgi:undecaprenyl-diphosphatase